MSISLVHRKITAFTVDEADLLLDLVVEEFQHFVRQDPSCGILVCDQLFVGRFSKEFQPS